MAEEQNAQVQEIERSAARLESELHRQIERMQSATRITLIVGIILVLVVIVSLTTLVSKLKDEARPERLAETAQAYARLGLPMLKDIAIEQAPVVAMSLREQVTGLIPLAGELVEDQAMGLADSLVDRVDAAADEVITKFIADQKTELASLIEHASEPDAAQELEKMFSESLEELVGAKMDELLVQFDRGMMVVDARLSRFMRPSAELTPEELFEKECVIRLMAFINDVSKQAVIEIAVPPAAVSN